MYSTLHLIAGTGNLDLAKKVAAHIARPLAEVSIFKFSNDNTFVRIEENVRGKDVFVIQPTCRPVNDNLMELLILIDALKRASAARITPVIPYYAYARSDKKDQPRVPITAKLVADLLETAGASRILAVDLHAEQIQGFFNIPVDHLSVSRLFIEYIVEQGWHDLVVVSPDAGGANRARKFANNLNCDLAIGDKRRTGNDGNAEILNIIGRVENRVALIVDDIVDSAGSLVKMAKAVKRQGARKVVACCTHAVLSGNAIERIEASPLERLIVSDSIPLQRESTKIKQISLAGLLGESIKRIHSEQSLSNLFI